MIGKVIVGGAALFGAAVAFGRTDQGRELLLAADEKLQDLDRWVAAKAEKAETGGGDSAAKLEEAMLHAAERAAKTLGLNVDDIKIHFQNVRDESRTPEPDAPTPPQA